jgi:hypothetical protein
MEIANFISDFENLPEKIQKQVIDYIEFLKTKYSGEKKKQQQFKFDWENGLSDLKNQYTSVELQHKANMMR